MASHKESCRCRQSDVKVFNYNDDWLRFALTSAHASHLFCAGTWMPRWGRRSSRIKQSCCLRTGKAKQQEQKKLRSSSKAGKNTVPTEDTQVEELTEQHAKRAKASEQPAAATKRKSKVMTVKERKSLLEFLDSGDDMVLVEVVKDDLKQQ